MPGVCQKCAEFVRMRVPTGDAKEDEWIDLKSFVDRPLWDQFDDLIFWIKDREGRFLWCNRALANHLNLDREEVLGCLDSDLYLNELAAVFMEDDASIIRDGKPILGKPELVMGPEGLIRWNRTSKFPIFSSSGRILGTYGMSRPTERTGDLPTDYADLANWVTYAHEEMGRGMTVAKLVRWAGVSQSSLERQTRRHLRMTPGELLQRIRIQHARHLLRSSDLKIGEIALACGYESFSAFSRAFRKIYGQAPGHFRRNRNHNHNHNHNHNRNRRL